MGGSFLKEDTNRCVGKTLGGKNVGAILGPLRWLR
jgi:hypothetical protein